MSEQIKIICVTDRRSCKGDFSERIDKLCQNGIDRFILREKDLLPGEYFALAGKVMKIAEKYNKEVFGNFFSEQALSAKMKGFQYSYKAFCEKKKRLFETEGVSVHSLEEAVNAQNMGADYLIAGHIFQTDCKKGIPPRGLDFLENICNAVSIPVYAIGGINAVNMRDCIDAGAEGVCMMSGLMRDTAL